MTPENSGRLIFCVCMDCTAISVRSVVRSQKRIVVSQTTENAQSIQPGKKKQETQTSFCTPHDANPYAANVPSGTVVLM